MSELPSNAPKPRLCQIVKWPDFDGYGFNLHADKSRPGQYIGKVDQDSPADVAGLREGDRIVEVNGVNISNENHKQVVERIKSTSNETRLLVLDVEADRWYKEHNIVVRGDQSNVIHGTSRKTTQQDSPPNGQIQKAEDGDDGSVGSTHSLHSETSTQRQLNSDTAVEADSPFNLKAIAVLIPGEDVAASGEVTVIECSGNNEPQESEGGTSRESLSSGSLPESHPTTEETASEPTTEETASEPHEEGKDDRKSSMSVTPSPPPSMEPEVQNHAAEVPNKKSDSMKNGDLNLNMTAAEMRARLASRKKHDPRKESIDLKKKYQIIQNM